MKKADVKTTLNGNNNEDYITPYTLKKYLDKYVGELTPSTNPLDAYPVGSVYISIYPTNPSTIFGGTWEQKKSAYIYASGGTSGARGDIIDGTGTGTKAATGNTGGTALTIEQMPNHKHDIISNHTGTVRPPIVDTAKNSAEFGLHYTDGTASWWANTGDMASVGGGKAHTHTLNSHVHKISSLVFYVWVRTA